MGPPGTLCGRGQPHAFLREGLLVPSLNMFCLLQSSAVCLGKSCCFNAFTLSLSIPVYKSQSGVWPGLSPRATCPALGSSLCNTAEGAGLAAPALPPWPFALLVGPVGRIRAEMGPLEPAGLSSAGCAPLRKEL